MAETVPVEIAEAQFAQLIARVEAGETISISRENAVVAQLVPVPPKGKRQFGALREKFEIGPEFFEPLPRSEWPFDWPGRLKIRIR